MPYASADDLPAEVRDALPPEALEIYVDAFNEAYYGECRDADDREGCSSKIAWAAVGQRTEIKNTSSFGPVETVPADAHEAILQGLNQWLPSPYPWVRGGKTYLGIKNFQGTEPKWDTVPMVFHPGDPVHPDTRALRENPEAELARIGARFAGRLQGSTIITAGTPRLSSQLIFEDPEVQKLHAENNLGISTGYDSFTFPSGHMAGLVEPSHVLLFDLRKGIPPNDPRTMFLNTGAKAMPDDTETQGILNRILAALERNSQGAPASHTNTASQLDPELPAKLEAERKAREAAEKEAAEARAKIAEYEAAEKKKAEEAHEAKWVEAKNLMSKGATHKPEDEKALRAEFDADPIGFAVKLIHENLGKKDPGRQAQGSTAHYNGPAPMKTDEERLAELGVPALVIEGAD
jgi:cation transport regulator ChaB